MSRFAWALLAAALSFSPAAAGICPTMVMFDTPGGGKLMLQVAPGPDGAAREQIVSWLSDRPSVELLPIKVEASFDGGATALTRPSRVTIDISDHLAPTRPTERVEIVVVVEGKEIIRAPYEGFPQPSKVQHFYAVAGIDRAGAVHRPEILDAFPAGGQITIQIVASSGEVLAERRLKLPTSKMLQGVRVKARAEAERRASSEAACNAQPPPPMILK